MFQHTLLLAYRGFLRFKNTFFINLIGLSTGLACALLIYLWVSDELSVDKFHEKDSRLFQVMENRKTAEGIGTNDQSAGLLAETLAEEFPEVEYAVSTELRDETKTLSVGDKSIKGKLFYASPDFFNTFTYQLIQGDKKEVLKNAKSIVISAELARKLFPATENSIGQTIELQHEKQYQVSGVFAGVPDNSSMQFDFVLPFEDYKKANPNVLNWTYNSVSAYVVLKEGTNSNQFNAKIADLIKRKSGEADRWLFLKKYSDNYLYGNYENGQPAGGRIEYVRLFSIIAGFILLIASINFMNLSTAKASRRIKEVGIKKAIGASRKVLVFQYLSESLLLSLLALLTAILLVILLLPQFNQITGKQLSLNFNVYHIYSLLGIALLTGLVAGSYPALYLSGFNPVTVLKGKLPTSMAELFIRKGLVIFQFTLSVVFIVSVLVVYQQLKYVQTKNLGYNKDHIIYLEMEGRVAANQELFLAEIRNIPGIVNASTIGDNIVGGGLNTWMDLNWEGKSPAEKVVFEMRPVNYNMIEMLGIKITTGRSFSRKFGTEESKIIFNEAAIKAMRLQDPIGKSITIQGTKLEIVGVAKDFNYASLHESVKPLFFVLQPGWTHLVMAKINPDNEKETIAQLEKSYKAFNPGFVFDYKFLDEDYQAQYVAEQRVGALAKYFTGLAILISCLGLFGLAAFTAERRRKEIGIRKVLGASEISIVYLLSSDFTKMVLMAIAISLPFSYIIVQHWLHNFEYRIDLEWWYFVGAGLAALIIAWLTVGTQAVKAASVNPVHSLKDE